MPVAAAVSAAPHFAGGTPASTESDNRLFNKAKWLLHLCEAPIDEQFCTRDVAAVVRCEKHHGLGDLIGCTEPAERNRVGNHLQALLARFCGSQQLAESGSVGRAWAHRVDANAVVL